MSMQFVALDDYFYKNSIYFCRILSFSFYKLRSVRRFNVLFVLKDDNNYGEFFMEKYISNFVDILKDYMLQKDLSRAEFAKNINSYERCISRWLDGTNTPSLEYILRVADFLHCSVDYLLGRTQIEIFTPCNPTSSFSNRLKELIAEKTISRNKLAILCGVTSSNVSKWILEGQLPKPDVIYFLATYFNCCIDYLLGRTNDK